MMDEEVRDLINREINRQEETITLIPSENYASRAVREAMGSVFANKYAEGYPGKRYYQGNSVVDELERLCQERAKYLFGVPFVNVQPLSGAPANLAILRALMGKDDVQLSQHLSTGGHLSMGQEASITAEYRQPIYYHLTAEGEVDWEELEKLARQHNPKIIWSGGTAYTKVFNWEKYARIANGAGAYLVADISHIGGLVAGGAHPSPVPFVHVVMTTTHKTLRGPRGAMIMVTEKGLKKDPDLQTKIDKAVFPGIQGGPHMENVAALAVALGETATPEFKSYARQIVVNAKTLASELSVNSYQLIGGGTENHMIWVDLRSKDVDGWTAAWALEFAGIIVNRQTIPGETGSAYYPSGIRLGSPAVTTRGMKEPEMKRIAGWIDGVIEIIKLQITNSNSQANHDIQITMDQGQRKEIKDKLRENRQLNKIAGEVRELARRFPIP